MMNSIEWISHRGLSDNRPDGVVENSIRSFERAVADGFEWLETDLRVSQDDQIFLQHDPTLVRTAGRHDTPETMHSMALRKIRLIDGQPLCFFEDFIDTFSSMQWVLDIKPEQGDRTLSILLDRYHGLLNQRIGKIWFQVWSNDHRLRILNSLPAARLFAPMHAIYRAGLATLAGLPQISGIRQHTLYGLPPKFMGIDLYQERMTRHYLNRGASLLAFLPEQDIHIEQALSLPYQFILTNRHKSDFVPLKSE